MPKTRGNLVPAKIYEVDKSGNPTGDAGVECMFNPYEYTVSKSNTYNEKPKNRSNAPQGEFFKAGSQSLKLVLLFDTYEDSTDVSLQTKKLWKYMMGKSKNGNRQNDKIAPPQVAFEWGKFVFVSYITSMSHKFTMFTEFGIPVRANVDITLTQYTDVDDYEKQNPTSGGGPIDQIWRVTAGDRLDLISASVYQDANKWRLIADYNGITNPLALRPGMHLRIPFE